VVYPSGIIKVLGNKKHLIRKDTHTMHKDNVIELKTPQRFVDDPISEVLRTGARKLLAEALEVEIEDYISQYKHRKDNQNRRRVVRNGYLPEREVQTGIGPVAVKAPRARDRQPDHESGPLRFTSSLLPPYLRKTKSMEELIPWLYLKGISTSDFTEALAALLGRDAAGLSASTISRLKDIWQEDLEHWQKRDLSSKRYLYIWAEGIYCNVRMEERQCLLVIIGATEDGKKELLALDSGFRESELSWTELLLDLKQRGLTIPPKLAIGDGALGFWKALSKVYHHTRWQRCWVHKTANVMNYVPKSLQARVKEKLQQIWMAPNKAEAQKSFDAFISLYEAKYPKATECLKKDREVLLTFYDFPAEHWIHIRTTNSIESTFSTVRLRTDKVRSCFSSKTLVTMAFKLCQCTQKRWQRLYGYRKLEKVISGIKFVDGVEEMRNAA
jgi:putative transposase